MPTSIDKETEDDSSFQKALQNLTNKVVDMEKIAYGNPSIKKNFVPYNYHNKSQPQQLTLSSPPMQGLNVEYGKMENYCLAHKQNHSERTCQVFINLYGSPAQPSTQAAGQPTITEIEGDIEDEGQEGEVEEPDTQPHRVNVTWDVMAEEVHVASNDYNLRSKGPTNTSQV